MFGIANRIAYDSQMVHAAGKVETGPIASVLERSSWFDVDGKATTKWCPAEGDMVVSLFEQLACAGVKEPDIFIISPFKIVADELKKRLIRERHLFAQLGVDVKKWVESCVGTVHTFQGREADSVFLVLGAPAAAHARARAWATESPNILNVAVSRAKRNLYVVGSYSAWSRTGCARVLGDSILR
jgi:superfamily I DNA and/or RNA helicase